MLTELDVIDNQLPGPIALRDALAETYAGSPIVSVVPAYDEGTVSSGYATHPYYGYHHRWHHYGARFHRSPRYGYMPYYYGHRVLRRYY